ncbi:MAG: NYN domain-containing protein [Hyphomicrobiaceae bacterium]|nr:NYN domain-containing protein [Hyphomicrobiaceae bacterium]
MSGILEALGRMLSPASPEAPYLWAILVLAGLLLAAIGLAMGRRRVSPGEVERIFLASTAANRRVREMSEIDTFVRKVNQSAEDVKARVRKLRTGAYVQVKIYIDHSNFIRSWTQAVHGRDRPQEHDIDWAALPAVLMEEISDWLTSQRKAPQAVVYRGSNVYGTLFADDYFKLLEGMLETEATNPEKLPLPLRLRRETIERWREENEAHRVELMRTIEGEMGYLVIPILRRTPREDNLYSANYTSGGIPIAPEKMLDTHVAVDLIGDATFDVFDIAVLMTEDSDFVPAVDFVQDMRGKMVIHVGFGGRMNGLRSKCRHRIDLGRKGLAQRVQRKRAGGGVGQVAATVPVAGGPPGNGGGRGPKG